MINFKLALRNALKHKGSSVVLVVIITFVVFALFWIFGFSNTFSATTSERELFFNGHLSYQIDFISADIMNSLIVTKNFGIVEKAEGKRRIMAISASKKESGPVFITDINKRNVTEYKKYSLDSGRLPETYDEIAISNDSKESRLSVGDSIYITTFTHDKIVNTIKYKIVGIGHLGELSLITESSMDILVNSKTYFNSIIVYVRGEVTAEKLASLDSSIKKAFTEASVKVDRSTNYIERMKESEILNTVFRALKIIVLIILFPLVGAVLGAIVWVHSYKRRGELWTYSSMGFKDSQIYKIATLEYLIISLAGFICGILLGFATSLISEAVNGMLVFSYVIETMLIAKVYAGDLFFIFAFVVVNVVFWIRVPVGKIIKAKPFSY
jgi:ABC-type lipoprotein release transport system permease subunit